MLRYCFTILMVFCFWASALAYAEQQQTGAIILAVIGGIFAVICAYVEYFQNIQKEEEIKQLKKRIEDLEKDK